VVEVDADADRETVIRIALASERVAAHLDGADVERVVVVPGRIVNVVTRPS
jgi:leucyl-tRNA synthetase